MTIELLGTRGVRLIARMIPRIIVREHTRNYLNRAIHDARRGAEVASLRLNRNQMVSSTDMARRFAEYLDRADKKGERLYVTRNNQIEAVLLNVEDFERLQVLEEIVEYAAISELVAEREAEEEIEVDLEALLRDEGLDPESLRKHADED